MSKFQGAMCAIVTPFKNGQVDEAGLRNLIDFQVENGTSAIVPCGTTGESATLTPGEHKRVIEIAIEQAKKRVPIIAGTGSNNTEEAIELTRHAKEAGADAVLMITPYYNKPTQEGLFQHFKAVAKTVNIQIILYNIPGRTAVNMEPDTIARLSRIENIIGIKEASGSMRQVMDIIARCGPDFTVLSGEDYLTFPIMCVGGKGVISVVSNIKPRDMYVLCNNLFVDQIRNARRLSYKLRPLCDTLFIETNPAPVKAALQMMGLIDSDEVRLPLVQMTAANRDKVRRALVDFGLSPLEKEKEEEFCTNT